jgi:hypothetical protein
LTANEEEKDGDGKTPTKRPNIIQKENAQQKRKTVMDSRLPDIDSPKPRKIKINSKLPTGKTGSTAKDGENTSDTGIEIDIISQHVIENVASTSTTTSDTSMDTRNSGATADTTLGTTVPLFVTLIMLSPR